ncbi:hypothetical protein [Saccharomonospora saliphila]|uniref:hypothetical protein n=1 Tax=Saccharomonospora saliphila TaxID=369829 RepID=UPI0018DD5C3B|nr:hypothetical protein [Saccharomonospora saliphila]
MAILLGIQAPAAASSAAGQGHPHQWKALDTAPRGSAVKQVVGTKEGPGNCVFDFRYALPPEGEALYVREIRRDLSRCVTEVAELRGQAALDAIAESNAEEKAEGRFKEVRKVAPTAGGEQSGPTASDHSYINSQGHGRTLWEDPIDATVAEVTNRVNWSWNNHNCVDPGWGGYRYYWLSASGWRLEENNFKNVYWCERQLSESSAHFFNGAFCAGIDTHAYWDRNQAAGDWDGWLRSGWSTRVEGGCTALLRFEHHLVREKN